jgi:hypothetical protein
MSNSERTPTPRPPAPNPRADAIERWERNRAMGRLQFIVRRGVVGWGIPAALVTIAYKVFAERGLSWRGPLTHEVRVAIMIAAIVFPLCGYVFGRWLWATGEENYRALVRGEPKPESREAR